MAQVVITINYREYPISCEDGGELQIIKLSQILDEKAHSLTQSLGQINENLLLAMVGLLIADELTETKKELASSTARAEDIEKIAELETAVNTANQQLKLLEEAKSYAEQESSDLQNTITEANKKITELEEKISQQNQQITSLEQALSASEQKVLDAETTTLETMEQISDIEAKLTNQEQQINELNQTNTAKEESIIELKRNLSDKEAEIEAHLTKIKELENNIAANAYEKASSVTAENLALIDEEIALQINSLSEQIKSIALKLKSI